MFRKMSGFWCDSQQCKQTSIANTCHYLYMLFLTNYPHFERTAHVVINYILFKYYFLS